MGSKRVVLFFILLAFWLAISGSVDIQHVIIGAILSFATVSFWDVLGKRLSRAPILGELFILGHCFVLILGYIIQANISLAKTLVLSKPDVSPVFMEMETDIKSNWGRVLLATCITITPGTITVDINPETGKIIVHTLTVQNASDLLRWRIIDRIRALETYQQSQI